MTTMTEVDRLRRDVAELRQQVLQRRYGMRADQVVLVLGDETVSAVVAQRLEALPPELRASIKPRVVALPFLVSRQVQGVQA